MTTIVIQIEESQDLGLKAKNQNLMKRIEQKESIFFDKSKIRQQQ